jgi:hypothetical protein
VTHRLVVPLALSGCGVEREDAVREEVLAFLVEAKDRMVAAVL